MARHGLAWLGTAGCHLAWLGTAGCRSAWLSTAWHGRAPLGTALHSSAWRGAAPCTSSWAPPRTAGAERGHGNVPLVPMGDRGAASGGQGVALSRRATHRSGGCSGGGGAVLRALQPSAPAGGGCDRRGLGAAGTQFMRQGGTSGRLLAGASWGRLAGAAGCGGRCELMAMASMACGQLVSSPLRTRSPPSCAVGLGGTPQRGGGAPHGHNIAGAMGGGRLVVAGAPQSTPQQHRSSVVATRRGERARLGNPGLLRPGAWLPAGWRSGAAAPQGGRGAGPQERQPRAGVR